MSKAVRFSSLHVSKPPMGEVEEWRPVSGYEGRYEVSNLGGMRSLPRKIRGPVSYFAGCVMKPSLHSHGYPQVTLRRDGHRCVRYVHRLVCEAFHGPCPQGMEVAHLDGNPANSVASNLAWTTHRENIGHCRQHGTQPLGGNHHNAKLTDAEAQEVRSSQGRVRAAELAERFGVRVGSIRRIWRGERYAHLIEEIAA